MYMVMYLQVPFVNECFITPTTAIRTFRSTYRLFKNKNGNNITILKRGKQFTKCELQIGYTNIIPEHLCSV